MPGIVPCWGTHWYGTLLGMRTGVGHSMGGLGAINAYLKSSVFKSVSAFSPICNPINCQWGQKAFEGYIGSDQSRWSEWCVGARRCTYLLAT